MAQKALKFYILFILTNLFFFSKATVFSNSSSITMVDNTSSNPYPSSISVSGMSGTIISVSVKIKNLSHGWVSDMGIVLQAPSGQALVLQCFTADGNSVNNLTYTISDAGATQFSNSSIWNNNGIYKPTAYAFQVWASPAPAIGNSNLPGPIGGGTATLASVFGGLNANGTWKLFVEDFASGDVGIIAGGWELDVVTNGSPVGLDLHSFTVFSINANNQLDWQTENESNFSHFDIEYCKDNGSFLKIGEVKSLNLSGKTSNYQFVHFPSNSSSIHYYRLKLIDKDGRFSYSKTLSIRRSRTEEGIKIYPTIVQDNIHIESKDKLITRVYLSNIYGQLVTLIQPQKYNLIYNVKSLSLSSGLYFISVYSEDCLLKKEKIIIQ